MSTPVIPDPPPADHDRPTPTRQRRPDHRAPGRRLRQPARRTLAAWGMIVVFSLVLVGTALHGLTTSAHVVGSTDPSGAEALYGQSVGTAAGAQPTDVIVVSSRPPMSVTRLRLFVNGLAAESVWRRCHRRHHRSGLDQPTGLHRRHATLIDLRAATDSDIKQVVTAIGANDTAAFPWR